MPLYKLEFKLLGNKSMSKEKVLEDLTIWRNYISDFMLESYKLIPSEEMVLDIGIGDSTINLSQHFPNLKILDRDPSRREEPKIKHFNIDYVFDIEDESVSDRVPTFNAIYCIEVLEHTTDPFKVIRNIIKLLNHNGILVVSVPCLLFYHPMLPICGDFWRFLPGHIEHLTAHQNTSCIAEKVCYPHGDADYPIGMCYILRKQ